MGVKSRAGSNPVEPTDKATHCDLLHFVVSRASLFYFAASAAPEVCLGKVARAMDGTMRIARSAIAGNIAIHNCLNQTSGVENPGYYCASTKATTGLRLSTKHG